MSGRGALRVLHDDRSLRLDAVDQFSDAWRLRLRGFNPRQDPGGVGSIWRIAISRRIDLRSVINAYLRISRALLLVQLRQLRVGIALSDFMPGFAAFAIELVAHILLYNIK